MKRVPHPNIHTKRGGGKGGGVRGGGRCVVDKWTTNYGRAVRIREIGSPISDRSTDAVVTDESGAVAVVGAVSGSEGGFLGRICTRTRLSDGLAGAVPGYGLDRQWRRGRSRPVARQRPTPRAGGPRTRGCVGPSTAALSSSTLVAGQIAKYAHRRSFKPTADRSSRFGRNHPEDAARSVTPTAAGRTQPTRCTGLLRSATRRSSCCCRRTASRCSAAGLRVSNWRRNRCLASSGTSSHASTR